MGGEPTIGTPVVGTAGLFDRQWVRWCAYDSLGVACAAAAATFAVMSLVAGSGGDHGQAYSSVQIPIATTILTTAVIIMICTMVGEYVRRTAPGSLRDGAFWGSLTALFIAVVIVGHCGLFTSHEFYGLAHGRAVSAFRLLACGGVAVVATYVARRVHIRKINGAQLVMDGRAWPIPVTTVLVVVAAVGALTIKPWQVADAATWSDGLRIELGDVRPVTAAAPSRVDPNPAEFTTGRGGFDGTMIAVGPGYLLGRSRMINVDNGVRWKITTPDSVRRLLVMVMPRKRTVLVVPDSIDATLSSDLPVYAGNNDIVAIDADTGTVRWRKRTPDWVWDLRDPDRRTSRNDSAVRADGDVIVAASRDGRVIHAVSPDDGTELWHHDVGRDCAVTGVLYGPGRVLARLGCGGSGSSALDLDAATGKPFGSRPDFVEELVTTSPAIVGRYRATDAHDRLDRTDLTALVDRTTGKPVVTLGNRQVISCAEDQCLIGDPGSGRLSLVSLTAPYRQITVAGTFDAPYAEHTLWLRDQLIWTGDVRKGDGDNGSGFDGPEQVVIVDRRTGEVVFRRTGRDFSSVLAVPGAVLVEHGGAFLRFQGAGQ